MTGRCFPSIQEARMTDVSRTQVTATHAAWFNIKLKHVSASSNDCCRIIELI